MEKSLLRKVIILPCMAVILAGLAVGNYECYIHENEITSQLVPAKITYDNSKLSEAQMAAGNVVDQIAQEGMTLMKNDGTLPLEIDEDDEDGYPINLFGIGSTDAENGFYLFGGGSGSVTLYDKDKVTLQQGIEQAGFEVNTSLLNFFKEEGENPKESWWEKEQNILKSAKAFSDTAVVTISRFTGENCDADENTTDQTSYSFSKPYQASYNDNDLDGRNFCQLSLREEAMLKWVSNNFDEVIVLINSGNMMELGFLDNPKINAILYTSYPGKSGTKAIGDILAGKVNPSGHLTDTFVYDTKSDPTWANVIAKKDNGTQIHYVEDIYTGYRWYETADKEGYFNSIGKNYNEVVFRPFGYGLYYTTFEWNFKNISFKNGDTIIPAINGDNVKDKDTKILIQVEVKNTGLVAGKDVVQLYYTAPYTKGGIEKAYVNLVAFEKTEMLYPLSQSSEDKPNSQILSLEFSLYDMASYDAYDKNKNNFTGYELEKGEYQLKLQNNAHELNKCENSTIKINLTNDLKWDEDPNTNGTIKNRFTGSTAENNIPIDGNNNGEKITYLSRADFLSTFPKTTTPNRTSGADSTKDGTYVTDEEYYKDITMPTLNSTETNLLLYTLENGEKASTNDLSGYTNNKIIPNEELILKLGENYDAPEWEQLLNQLSYIEIVDIVARCSCGTSPAESIGKPRTRVFDGPQGINNSTLSPEQLADVTAFPAETLVGMTFNKELARLEGAAMATEASLTGTIGIYAPAVDLHRHAYNGRNYEQYSEDPYLCGIMGGKMATGAITHGCQVSIKHFVCSQPGRNPRDYNTWLTEQNLRENYLKPFEIAIKESKANFLMTSFNNIGGVRCAYSYQLLNGVLREEWGFKGSIITDYDVNSASRTTANLIRSGNDLRFQGSVANRAELDKNNAVDVYLARQSVKRDLWSFCNTYYRTKNYDPNYTSTNVIVTQPFVWWIMVVIMIDVIIIGGIGVGIFFLFKPKKKALVNNIETDSSQEKSEHKFLFKKKENLSSTSAQNVVIDNNQGKISISKKDYEELIDLIDKLQDKLKKLK